MGTLANSEAPDEMSHYAAFHQGLHCLLRQNQSSVSNFIWKLLPVAPSINTIDYSKLIV